jgi:hypothetical protein
MEGSQVTRISRKRGCTLDFWLKWLFILYNRDFNGLLARFRRFNPFLEDLGPYLRPDLGGKLGVCFQIQVYINQRLLNPWEGGSDQENADELLRQSHFYVGKLLRSAPLWAIFGIFVHPFSVPSVLLGS